MAGGSSNRIVGILAILGIPLALFMSFGTNLVSTLFKAEQIANHRWLISAILVFLALLEFLRVKVLQDAEAREGRVSGSQLDAQLAAARLKILRLMKRRWVQGYLEMPLYTIARVELAMDEKPTALDSPAELVLRAVGATAHPLDGEKDAQSLLSELGSFVIIGAAGAGKTTRIAELVRDLVIRSGDDSSTYVPIALSLAEWTNKPVKEWAADYLIANQIPAGLAREWIRHPKVVLLLDALDEVPQSYRGECVAAINTFVNESQATVVVSCRAAEYERLPVKLSLETAVFVRPLTKDAINAAVEAAGGGLTMLADALRRVPDLYEVLDSPLMVDVARVVMPTQTIWSSTGLRQRLN